MPSLSKDLLLSLVSAPFLFLSPPVLAPVNLDTAFAAAKTTAPFDVTLEAENMPVKTTGSASEPGWALWDNGYIAQNLNFANSGLHRLTLRACGRLAAGEWSMAELRLDQAPQATTVVADSEYADFTVEFYVVAGIHQIAIAFINDYYDPPDDRNLYVDWLRVQFSGPADDQPPAISNIAAGHITPVSATVIWTTNEASDSQVEYGLTTSYGSSSSLDASLVASHAVALSNLQTNKVYHYRVKSKDAAGNLAVSEDATFVTLATGNVAFANVEDIFANHCARCHQGVTAPAGLVLLPGQAYANIVNVPSTEYPAWRRVQPNNRAVSWLYEKLVNPAPAAGSKMENLSAGEIELIGTWIDQGATSTPAPPYAGLEFRVTSLANGEIDIAYAASLVVWGGLPPYQFNVVEGDLPPGLDLDPAAGRIAGVPVATGQYHFTIRAGDSQSPAATLDQTYRLEIFNTREHWQIPPGFEIVPVVSNLHLPVNIAFVPNPGPNPADPYFYVTLLYGDIIMVQRDYQTRVYATGLLNFEPNAEFPGSGELGVTGIAVDPMSGDVFASMVYDDNGFKYSQVMRFHSADGGRTAATRTTIFSGISTTYSHQIQELTIGTDGKLYANVGDGFVPSAAPEVNDLRGKILRMNLDGGLPTDNPFPNHYVYATGLRNPFGAAWRAADNALYISDNGTDVDDRLIKAGPGENYGWDLVNPDLTKGAIHLWNPTVAPVAMDFLNHAAFPAAYYGQLFVALSGEPYLNGQSFVGKKIQRFALDNNGRVVSDSLFLDYIGAGWATVIGVAFGPDGLYFTDLYGENGFDGFGQTQANVYRLRWISNDSIAPAISDVQTANVNASRAAIFWQTDEPAKRQVEYGPAPNYGNWTPLGADFSTSHDVTLAQLAPKTTYHFRVWNWDATNNGAVSAGFTFTTVAVDSIATAISNVRVDSMAAHRALILWDTNEPATSVVDYGITTSYGFSVSSAGLVTAHRVWLAGLSDSTLHHFRVKSQDAAGFLVVSGDFSFTTISSTPAFTVTLEAENMPIKTTGDARPPGWILSDEGYIAEEVNFPSTGSYQFTLRAFGNFIGGEWPKAELRIDRATQAIVTVAGTNYTDFTAIFSVEAGTHEVAVAFINDYWDPPDDRNLWVDWLRIQTARMLTNVADERSALWREKLPPALALQNYPNPFNAGTWISLALPHSAEIYLTVYDLAGREVKELMAGSRLAGNYEITWDGRNREGSVASSGVYLLRLRYRDGAGGAWSQLVRRIVMMK